MYNSSKLRSTVNVFGANLDYMNPHLLSAPPRYAVSSALKEITSQVQAPLTSELCAAAKVGAYTTLRLQLLQYEICVVCLECVLECTS